MADKELDVRGLSCPLPVLRAKKALDQMPDGALLSVIASDPGAVADFPLLCRQTGNTLIDSQGDQGVYRFLIRKGAAG